MTQRTTLNPVTLYVKCFGTPQIALNCELITPLLGRKVLALFLYLAVTGRPHRRDSLADLLWREQSNQAARNNLRYLLPELRKAVGDYLLITPHTIAFDQSQPYALDCEHFRNTLTQALDTLSTAELQANLDLYQDNFLAGVHVRNAPAFEEWVTSQQTELHMLAVTGLHHLAERYYIAGNDTEGIMTAQRLLSLEPWHEAGHRLLMKLLVLQGQRSAALAQYQRLQQVLADELAAEPEDETQQLYEMISRGCCLPTTPHLSALPATVAVTTQGATHSSVLPPTSPPPAEEAPAGSTKNNLPSQLTPFFGREQEITDLYAQLQQDDYRLITLTGEGGIGKTRLALAVAQAMVDTKFWRLALGSPIQPDATTQTAHQKFPDGIWFVPLSGLRAVADVSEQLAIAIAQAMNFSFSTTSALIAQLLAYLRHKRTLLILDNFEQLNTGAAFVLDLLQKTTGVKLLITSRTVLNLQAEYQWAVTGLPTPSSEQVQIATVAELLRYSSITLFVERARRVQRSFQLDEMNRHTVCHICRLLHGLPLGIELAAAQLRFYTCMAISQTLATNAITLTTNYRDLPLRHRSLAAVLEDSWSLLTTAAQIVLARLSSFQGSFTVDAAVTVAQTAPILLTNLCDNSLLQQNTSQGYLLHEFVRQFAAEKLKLAGSEEAYTTAERHARYYLALPQAYEKTFQGPTPQVAITALQQALVNIEQAWHWGVAQQESTLLAQCCLGLFEFYYCTNLLEKGKQIFATAIAMIQQLVTTAMVAKANQLEVDLATLLYAQGHLLVAQNAYANAVCLAQQVVTLADKQKVPELVVRGAYLWGLGLSSLGEYAQAEQQLTTALALARTTNQQNLTMLALVRLARLAEFRAHYTVAQQYGAEALAMSRASANLVAESLSLTTLGIIYQRLGDFGQAKTCWETALALNEQSGITASRAALLLNLGTICDNLGNYAAAQRHYQAALQLSRDNGIVQLEAEVLGNLGISADYVGDYTAALNYSQDCLQRWQHLRITGRLPIVLVNLGLHAHHLGDHKAAQLYGQQALTLSQESNNRHLQSYAWTILGHAATALQAFVTAETAYIEAIHLAHRLTIPLMTIEPLAGLVRIGLARQVAYPLIQPYLEEIIDFLTRNAGDGLEEPFRVYLTCYEGLQAMGDLRTEPFLETAYALLQKRTAQIDEPALQRSFLENVEANRKLCMAAQLVKL